MCGLFGVFKPTHLNTQERRALVDLGSLSFFRGTDSTGICTISKKKPKSPKYEWEITKSTDHPIDFFKQGAVLKEVFNQKVTSVLGHARAATHGTVNETNAHPFREGALIGTHNGVVRKYTPDKKQEDEATDSRLLYRALDKGDIEQVLRDLYGNDAYALAFYDLEYCSLNFVRNDKRPIYMCKTAQGTIFWASEPYMLTFALLRNDLTCEDLKIIPEGVLISLDLMTGEPEVKTLKLTTTSNYVFRSAHQYQRMYDTSGAASVIAPWRNEPNDEIPFKDTGTVADSHANMRKFMDKTREDYVKGAAAVTYERVVEGPTLDENEAATKNLEEQLDQVMAELVKKADAVTNTEVDQRVVSFPVRTVESDLDKASYKVRKYGVEQWVSVPVARSYLRNGCLACKAVSSVDETAYWKGPSEYLCDSCYVDPMVVDYYGTRLSEFIESDLMLDTHISMYGG